MNDVCMYCGKVNGWHLWGCPNLELRFSVQVYGIGGEVSATLGADGLLAKPGEPVAEPSWPGIGNLKTLPEVE